jgi:hypothetical protein
LPSSPTRKYKLWDLEGRNETTGGERGSGKDAGLGMEEGRTKQQNNKPQV